MQNWQRTWRRGHDVCDVSAHRRQRGFASTRLACHVTQPSTCVDSCFSTAAHAGPLPPFSSLSPSPPPPSRPLLCSAAAASAKAPTQPAATNAVPSSSGDTRDAGAGAAQAMTQQLVKHDMWSAARLPLRFRLTHRCRLVRLLPGRRAARSWQPAGRAGATKPPACAADKCRISVAGALLACLRQRTHPASVESSASSSSENASASSANAGEDRKSGAVITAAATTPATAHRRDFGMPRAAAHAVALRRVAVARRHSSGGAGRRDSAAASALAAP